MEGDGTDCLHSFKYPFHPLLLLVTGNSSSKRNSAWELWKVFSLLGGNRKNSGCFPFSLYRDICLRETSEAMVPRAARLRMTGGADPGDEKVPGPTLSHSWNAKPIS